jgi:molybdopterin converting factor small subunit
VAVVHINFIGPWRVILEVKTVTINITSIDQARNYVETNFGPQFEKKLRTMGAHRKQSIWENSNILLNGTRISTSNGVILREGDRLEVIPKVAGG